MYSNLSTTIILLLTIGCSWISCSRADDDRVVVWHFGNAIHPGNGSIYFDLKIFAPTQPGTYPLIVFFTGLDGFAQALLYTDFSTKLVYTSESIVVALDTIRYPSLPDREQHYFAQTLNWTLLNIHDLIQGPNTPDIIKNLVFPDIKSSAGVTLMGHSASGHPVTGYLVNSCGLIKTLILLDPVDGYDPFGFVKSYVTHPPNQLSFVTPTLVIATGYDSVRVLLISQNLFKLINSFNWSIKVPAIHGSPTACAPANLSNTRFYECMPGPTWMLNFTDYGHADILDDWVNQFTCLVAPRLKEFRGLESKFHINFAQNLTV